MNSNNCSGQNVSINVNLSLKNETLRMLIEMANDMGASLEDVISSITEDSVIDLERLQDDLGIVIIPEKCSKQDLIKKRLYHSLMHLLDLIQHKQPFHIQKSLKV